MKNPPTENSLYTDLTLPTESGSICDGKCMTLSDSNLVQGNGAAGTDCYSKDKEFYETQGTCSEYKLAHVGTGIELAEIMNDVVDVNVCTRKCNVT